MIILGLDLSLTSTGYCITHYNSAIKTFTVLDVGAIHTVADNELPHALDVIRRSRIIRDSLLPLLRDYEVDDVCVEAPSYGSVGSATRDLAMLWAIVVEGINEVDISTVPPTTLKKASTGFGRASKKDMLECISDYDHKLFEKLLNTTIKAGKYDIADAYLLTRYHGNFS